MSLGTLVFVYGTLKRGCSNHRVLADQIFVAEARTVPGYHLYHLGDYPGMIATSDDTLGVAGEVWSVDPAALARLDAFEGVHESLYRREPIKLLAPFTDRHVETYLYAQSIEKGIVLDDGIWREP
jgi:gamma-glutamylcyclotransferase (GGCT)/AIG2-like uncharacterized protein YtfP